ncbi:MAG TPA: glyceraldehyde 3-phosphate dehydrogenase NAD-binding domain-containing protein [Thermoanaerobaculia bacterium]
MSTVAIFGFGRIGRNLFRILQSRRDIRVGAIADPADPEALAYLLRFDTLLGRFPEPVTLRDGALEAGTRRVELLTGDAANRMPWRDLGVHTVLEATSRSRSRAELARHLDAGARRVISLAPPADAADLLAVPGLTEDHIHPDQRVVSNASSTVHAAAPVLAVLQREFGIRRAMFTIVHSYTSQNRLADVPAEDKRRGRAAAENIIPQESRSPAMLGAVLPELSGKISGNAMNVPVANGSVVDLVCWHEKPVTPAAVNDALRNAAAEERWRRILQYEREPIVSSDVAHSTYSSVFDSLATQSLAGRVSKTLSWFDSGYGYAHRAVELLDLYAAREGVA